MKLTITVLVLLSLLAGTAFAQESFEQRYKPRDKNFMLSVDTVTFLLRGAGIAGDYAVSPKLSLGAHISRVKPSSIANGIGFSESENTIRKNTVRARYYLSDSFSNGGVYASAAIVQATLRTKARSTLFGTGPWGEGEITKTGGEGGIGYQFSGSGSDRNFVIGLGLLYGTGNKYGYEYRSTGNTATVTPILEDGASLEGNLSWMF